MIRRLLDALRDLAARAWRVIPERLRLRLLAELVRAEGQGEAGGALERLFAVQDRLDAAVTLAAMRYDKGLHPKHRLTGYHDYFVARIADGQRVLDVGCGIGSVAHTIANGRDVTVVGIDTDAGSIAIARERYRHPKLEFRVGDVRRELPDGPWDVVVLSNVLEHLEHRREFLLALKEKVGPRKLLIRLPLFERSWTVPMRRELGLTWMGDDTHFAELTQEGWVAELEAAGLTVTHRAVAWGEIWCEASWPA